MQPTETSWADRGTCVIMTYGIAFDWTDGPTPDGGEVMLWDDHGLIVCHLSRPAFAEDPEGFMHAFERHLNASTKGKSLRLAG
jgi:hypothetical protein